MPSLFYAGQPDYIEKLNTLAGVASMTNGTVMNVATLSVDTTIPASYNASMVGPVTVGSGVTLTVESGATLVFL